MLVHVRMGDAYVQYAMYVARGKENNTIIMSIP
jgi:hypothetical protein